MLRSHRVAGGVFITLLMSLATSAIGPASAAPVTTIRNNGSPANRVDLVILGDGYTSGEMAKYAVDAETAVQGFFASEAFSEYRNYFNVHRVDVISNESGADHPHLNIFKDTALDAAYDCAGIQRLICVNQTKVNTVVTASLPAGSRDMILVIVNDAEYGGSGGAVAVASTHIDAVEIVLHEVGHSLGLLADEYGGPPPPSCVLTEPSEVNATMVTNRPLIKWTQWIDATTPLPTPGGSVGLPGLYEGAKYCTTGMYRPTDQSKMRFLYKPFEQINDEQLIRRIYSFVSPLDSAQPATSSLSLWQTGSFGFAVTTPLPFTHTLDVGWTIDGGASLGTGTALDLNLGAHGLGSHVLDAAIRDQTSMVRSDPSQLLVEHRTWNVTLAPVPTLSVTPNTGSGSSATLSAQFSDALGSANLAQLFVRIAAAPTGNTNTCAMRYDTVTALFSLRDDGGNWLPGIPLPSGDTVHNSQCSVALAASAVSTTANTLTLTVEVSFTTAYGGSKNVYVNAGSVPGQTTGFQLVGVWAVTGNVQAVSVSPNSGSGVTQLFTFSYADSAGAAADLNGAFVRFTNVANPLLMCTIQHRATTGKVRIMLDDGITWGPFVDYGSGTISNSQCSLDLATSAATPNGNDLTLALKITFLPAFAGPAAISMRAQSLSGPNTGWLSKGSWTVGAVLDALSITPNSGTGVTQIFTAIFSDSLGVMNDLKVARVRFGASTVNACVVDYNAIAGTVRLLDDAGVPPPFGPFIGVLANSQCSVDLGQSGAAPGFTNLTLNLRITFKAGFVGQQPIFLRANSNFGATTTGWLARGTWNVNAVVQAISVSPNAGTGSTQSFVLAYSDLEGVIADLKAARVRIQSVGGSQCLIDYNAMTNRVRVMSDDLVTWSNAFTPGTVKIISNNSQCSLDVGQSSAAPSGTGLALTLAITFKPAFAGAKTIDMRANSNVGSSTNWVGRGTWTVP